MKKTFQHPTALKVAAFLAILAIMLPWAIQRSQAQSQPAEDNYPMGSVSGSPQTTLPYSPEDINSTRMDQEQAAELPDLVITDPSLDVMAEVEKASGVKAGYSMVIPAADFTPDSDTRTWFFGFNSAYLYPTSVSGYCGIAPLYLPDGATVTSFIAYVYDNDPLAAVSAFLYAKPLGSTTSSTTMATVGTTNDGVGTTLQTVIDTNITQATIDNAAYTYHFGICMWGQTSDTRFYASQILYNK